MGGFEPPLSCSQSRRLRPLGHIPVNIGMGGFEPPISWSRTRRLRPLGHIPITWYYSGTMLDGQPQIAQLAQRVDSLLEGLYPEVQPFLHYRNPFELLVGVVLSAQSTDAQVNRILPSLFERWPGPCDWAEAPIDELERAVFSTGFYRVKARNLKQAARMLCARGGEVPMDMEDLLQLPGVGRKSANVLRGALGGLPAIIVDTHFARVVRRLGLTTSNSPDAIEGELARLVAPERSYPFSMRINLHGRLVCKAHRPGCDNCALKDLCGYVRETRARP